MKSLSHLVKQVIDYSGHTFAFIIIIVMAFVAVLFSQLKNWGKPGNKPNSFAILGSINVVNFSRPFFKVRFDLMTFMLLVNTLLVLCRMGLHAGNFFSYFAHLITPFLLIVALNYLDKRTEKTFALSLLLTNLIIISFFLPGLPKSNQLLWNEWRNIISASDNVYTCPVLTHILYKQNGKIYDNGSSQYFSIGINGSPEPLAAKARKRYEQYRNELNDLVKQNLFDLIIIPEGMPFWDDGSIEKEYTIVETKDVYALRIWKLNIWKPKRQCN